MASQSNEFRKRGSGMNRHSPTHGSSSSLPRPGFAPRRGSPTPPQRKSYSGVPAPQPFPAQAVRSNSYSASPAVAQRPTYSTSAAYNPNNNNGSQYSSNGNYGGYGSSNGGYTNGLSSSSSSGHRSSLGSDDKYAKKPKRKSSGGDMGFGFVVGGILLFVYAIFMTTLYFSKSGSLKSMLKRLDQPDTLSVITKVEDLERKLKSAEVSKRSAETTAKNKVAQQMHKMERESKSNKEKHDNLLLKELPAANEKIERFGNREKAFMDQVGWLMDRTRRESKRMVLERFGPGPHKVEVTYVIRGDGDANIEDRRYKFIIELAPLDLVPHAIHLFLEQVDHGLLEDTHFYLNGPHIVQAGPQPDWNLHDYDDKDFSKKPNVETQEKISVDALETITKYEKQVASSKVPVYDDDSYEAYYTEEDYYEEDKRTKRFQDLGLDQLAFPDYSEEYPHVSWTVGYTGRPGGPDWYINKVDNTKGHGPGGQMQHSLQEQGDSCFGTISEEGDGRNLLASHIYSLKVYGDKSEWHHFISRPVRIVYAEILTKDPILDRHLHLGHLHSQHQVYGSRRRKGEANAEEGETPADSGEHRGNMFHMDGATEA